MAVLQDTSGYRGPYQYYNSVDPNSLYNADGTLKSNKTSAAVDPFITKGIDMAISAANPIAGAVVGAGQAIASPLRQIGTPVASGFAGAFDPIGSAERYYGDLKHNQAGQSSAMKGFEDSVAWIPGVSAALEAINQKNRNNEQAGYNYNKQFYNGGGYGYELDKNGMRFAPQGRPQFTSQTSNPSAGIGAASSGLASFGGDLLKQLLARPSTPPTPIGEITDGAEAEENPDLAATDSPLNTRRAIPFTNESNLPDIADNKMLDALNGFKSPKMDNMGGDAADQEDGTPFNNNQSIVTTVHKDGGVAHVKGGKGDDDIALVHADSGKDTGVRVEKGEMIVFSKENVDALKKAIESGDKDGVFNLAKAQIKLKGKQTDTTNYAEGGVGNVGDPDTDIYGGKVGKLVHYKDAQGREYAIDVSDQKYPSKYQVVTQNGKKTLRPDGYATPTKIVTKGGQQLSIYDTGNGRAVDATDGTQYEKAQGGLGWNEVKSTPVAPPIHKDSLAGQTLAQATHANGAPKYKPDANGNVQYHTPDGHDPNKATTEPNKATTEPKQDLKSDTTGPKQDLKSDTTGPKQDLKSDTTGPTDQEIKHGIDWASAGDYGTSAAKVALGMAGANQPLPNWQISPDWAEYANHMKYLSTTGLSPYEMALAKNNADSTYLSTLERNKQVGGANPGAIMQADQIANAAHNTAAVQLAAANHQANISNLSAYAPVAEQQLRNSRTQYTDAYDRANATKMSGAALAAMGESDIKNHEMYDKFYGPNSDYKKLKDIELERQQTAADSEKSGFEYNKKHAGDVGYTGKTNPYWNNQTDANKNTNGYKPDPNIIAFLKKNNYDYSQNYTQ